MLFFSGVDSYPMTLYYLRRFLQLCIVAAAKADNGLYSSDEDRSELGRCPRVPDGYCAVLYDDENCEGWSHNIPTGTSELPEEFKNDAEVVVVKNGCKFTG